MSKRIIGRCSECGGNVVVPELWWSVKPPVATCESCGATEKNNLPVIPMTPRPNPVPFRPRPNDDFKRPFWPNPWDDTKPWKPEPDYIKYPLVCSN